MPEYSAKILGALWSPCSYAQVAALSNTLAALPGDLWLSPLSTEPAINNPFVVSIGGAFHAPPLSLHRCIFDNSRASGPTCNVSSNQVVHVESHWVGHWITTTDNLQFFMITFTDAVSGDGANGCLVYSLETGSSSSSYISDTPRSASKSSLASSTSCRA